MIQKEKRTVQKTHKVITKKQCSNDIAKEIKDKKVPRCSSCQMFSSKSGWMQQNERAEPFHCLTELQIG